MKSIDPEMLFRHKKLEMQEVDIDVKMAEMEADNSIPEWRKKMAKKQMMLQKKLLAKQRKDYEWQDIAKGGPY